MPRVLVLHPGTISFRQEQVARHREFLRENDIQLVLADDSLVDSDREWFDDCIALPPAERVRDALRILDRYCAEHDVDAVLSQSESSVLLGALVYRRLSLPGISPRAAHLCVNKHASRVALQRARVAVPRFGLARDAAGVRSLASDFGFPIVLKGVASALGRLVTLVKSAGEIDAAVARVSAGVARSLDIERLCDFADTAGLDPGCDPRREFLVEAFARGEPVETDGLVLGAKPCSFGVTEQVLSAPPRFYLEGYLSPAERPAHELASIERTSAAALAALCVENSGYSIEMRFDRGEASVIEVNGRLGWDEGFGDMFERTTGCQPMIATLHQALGFAPPVARREGAHCALAYASCYDDAIVERVPTAEELASLQDGRVTLGLATYEQARLHAPPHPDVSPHLAYALAEHATSSRAAFAVAQAAVRRVPFEIRRVTR
jgi:hypothetical protein